MPEAKAGAGSIRSRLARRFGWGLADQMMSSLSNAAMSFYVARELGAIAFGAFSLAYVTYSFCLNASRGLATDPLLVRYSNVKLPVWRRAVARSTGTSMATGLILGLCAVVAAAALSGTVKVAFFALGLTLPGLLLQDSWRYAFFALGRGGHAFLNDTVWTATMLPAMLALRLTHHNSVFGFVLAWGVTAWLAACVGPIQARLIPRPAAAWQWVSRHRDLAPRYLAENTSNSGAAQLRSYSIGAIAGLAAVGYVQAAGLLMGPFLVVFMGISLVTVPEAARILHNTPQYFRRYCALVGGALAAFGLLWGLGLLIVMPLGAGTLLLGSQLWRPAYALVLPYSISVMGGCLIDGAAAGLHALGAAKRSLRAMIVASAFFLVFGVVGAYLGGAAGTVWGAAFATWAGAGMWWWQLQSGIRDNGTALGRRHKTGRHRKQRPEPAARAWSKDVQPGTVTSANSGAHVSRKRDSFNPGAGEAV